MVYYLEHIYLYYNRPIPIYRGQTDCGAHGGAIAVRHSGPLTMLWTYPRRVSFHCDIHSVFIIAMYVTNLFGQRTSYYDANREICIYLAGGIIMH